MSAQPQTELALTSKNIVSITTDKIKQFMESGAIRLPADYSPENALKSAWIILQGTVDREKRPALEVCDKNSIANALLDMVVQGLNPAKKQLYLIVYGKQLVCQRSYFGEMALAERVRPGITFHYDVVYKGDVFKFSKVPGKQGVTAFEQELGNMDSKNIEGAFCQVMDENGVVIAFEVMSMEQIQKSWGMSKVNTTAADSTHQKFKADMCLRTVIRKVCKPIINSSNDAYLMDAIERQDELAAEASIDAEAIELGNQEVLSLESTPIEQPTLEVETAEPEKKTEAAPF